MHPDKLALPHEQEEDVESLEDMEPDERAELEACLEEGLRALEQGDHTRFVSGERLIQRLLARK